MNTGKSFLIEPQRNLLAGAGGDETRYVLCLPDEAEIWVLFVETDSGGDFDLVDDYQTRDAAYAAAMNMGYNPNRRWWNE